MQESTLKHVPRFLDFAIDDKGGPKRIFVDAQLNVFQPLKSISNVFYNTS